MTPRAIFLTSTFLRHQHVANVLADRLDLVGLWQEAKSFEPARYAGTQEERETIERHFAERDRAEEDDFAEDSNLRLAPGAARRTLPAGAINDPAEVARMRAARPDVVLVFGTGLLRDPVLEAFQGRIVNLHLGLSPYYRGSGTNFWPLVNREPEYLGATIHFLDAGIDTGPLLCHSRPRIEEDDGPHGLGNRAISAAAEALAEAAIAVARGPVRSVAQASRGRLYQRKDFNAGAVARLRRNFETGMLAEYLRERGDRDAKLDLVRLEAA